MRYTSCLIALCAFLVPFSARADELADVRSYLQQQVAAHKFSGDVLIAVHDRVIFERAYGDANVELHVPNTLQTRFRIFSVTKQFTAAAIMTLAQQGKLDVSAPVSRYLPQFPQPWSRVTIAEMLNHSSGLPQLENTWAQGFLDTPKRQSQCEDYDAVVSGLQTDPPSNAPGVKWEYNNFAYDLLGCVIERTSGTGLAAYMRQAIFAPAKMTDSGLVGRSPDPEPMYDGPLIVSGMATGYNGTLGVLGRLQQAMPEQFASAAAGDVYSTVGDLWRYSEALYSANILTPATQQTMLAESVPVSAVARWGLGWAVTTVGGHTFMHHSGSNNGYTAEFARFPEERATIVILSNFGFADVTGIRVGIAERVFHGKYTAK